MKEVPIIFSPPMVKAILAGNKIQTRRVMHPQPYLVGETQFYKKGKHVYGLPDSDNPFNDLLGLWDVCPYGKPGDRLWVREAWQVDKAYHLCSAKHLPHDNRLLACGSVPHIGGAFMINYCADGRCVDYVGRVRPSIHMPRWASRITLEVVSVRAERVQQISEADAKAEGASCCLWYEPFGKEEGDSINLSGDAINPVHPTHGGERGISYRNGFATLWDSINAKRGFGWEANPYVWVIEFKKV